MTPRAAAAGVGGQPSAGPGPRERSRAVALADGRAESPLETRGRLRIVGAGLPTPELQVEIRVGGRLVGVVDAWFEDAAVAVEFDGRVKYTDPWRGRTPEQVLWEEKRREDELRALDIRVVRIADADLGARLAGGRAAAAATCCATPGPAARRFTATRARGASPRDRLTPPDARRGARSSRHDGGSGAPRTASVVRLAQPRLPASSRGGAGLPCE